MKSIVFVRHAKSSWDYEVSDLNRPLSRRGFTDATLVSNAFGTYNFIPDAIYSSSANRARTTCQIFMDNLDLEIDLLTIDEKLYDFGGDKVLRFIKSLDNSLGKVMIFGHNYAFTTLANTLGDISVDNLPTSGLVMIDSEISQWKDLIRGKTKVILKPKDFK